MKHNFIEGSGGGREERERLGSVEKKKEPQKKKESTENP